MGFYQLRLGCVACLLRMIGTFKICWLLILTVFRQKKLEKAAVNNFYIKDIVQPSMTCFGFIWSASVSIVSFVHHSSLMFAISCLTDFS